ncbi:MAG TPA: lactoylglutathione lyase [Rhodospirillaceae bacterium]|nr:lactoylglutathione lyase [Rhodospirillaceae bacterium]HAT36684.1 lactoylglutathione lyase [Rhodospirillaceae bacterium]
MRYLHTMVRVSDLEDSIKFFGMLGLSEVRRRDSEKGRFTNVHLAAKDDIEVAKSVRAPTLELTYNWDPEDYQGGRNFGHLAFEVDDIYGTCQTLMENGVDINRPPRDGHMAFIRTPDGISIELLQKGESLPEQEPWVSMENTGSW